MNVSSITPQYRTGSGLLHDVRLEAHQLRRELEPFRHPSSIAVCPFLNFKLELTDDSDVWLSLTGPDGVKAFLREAMR